MWGLILSAVTIAISFLTETGREDRLTARTARQASGSISRHHSTSLLSFRVLDDHVFLSGALMGIGLSLFCSNFSRSFKVSERCKLLVRSWWNWEKAAEIPLRLPVAIMATPTMLGNNGGVIRLLVSPHTSATWNLQVTVLTLTPGSEMTSARAPAVEFYYVVSGSGMFSQQGIIETSEIRTGDCFVVEVGQMRWISNSSALTEDLVLLRATDGGGNRSSIMSDMIRMDPNRRATTVEAIKDSFRHVHSLARGYVNGVVDTTT